MGLFQLGKENEERCKRDGLNIVRKLICKAQKRKKTAENFHIYALLQATIVRLQEDDHLTQMKLVKSRCNRKSMDSLTNNFCRNNNSFEYDGVVGGDQDVLQLNSFFEQLKNR